jgi:rare lipoprotein A
MGLSICVWGWLALSVAAQTASLTIATNPVQVAKASTTAIVVPAVLDPWAAPALSGKASWYGEENRGKLMANGQRFDPDKLTAASWFYPLGTRVRVSLKTDPRVLNPPPARGVWVTITDRGPHHRFVRTGRIIDLSYAVFRRLADPEIGLIEVVVHAEAGPQNWLFALRGDHRIFPLTSFA